MHFNVKTFLWLSVFSLWMQMNYMGQILPEKKYKYTPVVTSMGDLPDQVQWSILRDEWDQNNNILMPSSVW